MSSSLAELAAHLRQRRRERLRKLVGALGTSPQAPPAGAACTSAALCGRVLELLQRRNYSARELEQAIRAPVATTLTELRGEYLIEFVAKDQVWRRTQSRTENLNDSMILTLAGDRAVRIACKSPVTREQAEAAIAGHIGRAVTLGVSRFGWTEGRTTWVNYPVVDVPVPPPGRAPPAGASRTLFSA